MCLGIPGKIIEIVDETHRIAKVDVSGVKRNVSLGVLEPDEAKVGDWVLIHVGFAISKIDEKEAEVTYRFLKEMGQAFEDELQQFSESQIE